MAYGPVTTLQDILRLGVGTSLEDALHQIDGCYDLVGAYVDDAGAAVVVLGFMAGRPGEERGLGEGRIPVCGVFLDGRLSKLCDTDALWGRLGDCTLTNDQALEALLEHANCYQRALAVLAAAPPVDEAALWDRFLALDAFDPEPGFDPVQTALVERAHSGYDGPRVPHLEALLGARQRLNGLRFGLGASRADVIGALGPPSFEVTEGNRSATYFHTRHDERGIETRGPLIVFESGRVVAVHGAWATSTFGRR